MKHGTFYLLSQKLRINNEFSCLENLICRLISTEWRSGKSILITCEDKRQAIKIDEILWVFDKDVFLPHNLFERTTHKVPILIYWNQCCYDYKPRDLLINLMKKNMDFFFNFNEIIDFVPITEILKKWARYRYQSYKRNGFKLDVVNVSM